MGAFKGIELMPLGGVFRFYQSDRAKDIDKV